MHVVAHDLAFVLVRVIFVWFQCSVGIHVQRCVVKVVDVTFVSISDLIKVY